MGRQHGLQVMCRRPFILEAIEARFLQIESSNPGERFESLVQETAEVLREIDPPILEMIRGQAEALEIDFEILLRYDLVSYLHTDLFAGRAIVNEGCTTWAAVGSAMADGDPLLAKNRDYRPEYLPLQILVTATPALGYRYVYGSSAGSPGVFQSGMNEKGLAVADTYVCSTDVGPGLPDYSLMMYILEEHDTVRSALDYLSSVPRMGRNNLILADAEGDVAVVELGYHHSAVIEAQGGILVNANHFVNPSMEESFVDPNPPPLKGNSFHRYDLVRRELEAAQGSIDLAFARRLMATHAGPLASICRHLELDGRSATTASTIYQPARRILSFCHGYPCQSPYRTVVFDEERGFLLESVAHEE